MLIISPHTVQTQTWGPFHQKKSSQFGETHQNLSEKNVESARNCEQRPQLDINGLYDTSRGGEAMPNFVNHQGNGTHPWFHFFWWNGPLCFALQNANPATLFYWACSHYLTSLRLHKYFDLLNTNDMNTDPT